MPVNSSCESKPVSETDASLLDDLRMLVEPETRGDPQSPLLWTCKSLRKLSQSLRDMGHTVGRTLVGELLHKLDYRLQANRKTREGSHNPDRDAQVHDINDRVKAALAAGGPAISVDTKKKELVGDFRNVGREWRPQGSPEQVRVHDFVIPELGRAVPYGVYDIAGNAGWVSVGIDHDTAAFAANAIRSWWKLMGRERYPNASSLLITADGGGSNGSRVRLWKIELQKLADELGVPITVCHLPPGTSKWNKIEHRLFSFITGNWRGKPLISHQVIVQLIAATTTKTGLRFVANSTTTPIRPAPRCPMPKWMPSTSPATTSTANGTIRSARKPSPWSDSSRTSPYGGSQRGGIARRRSHYGVIFARSVTALGSTSR